MGRKVGSKRREVGMCIVYVGHWKEPCPSLKGLETGKLTRKWKFLTKSLRVIYRNYILG